MTGGAPQMRPDPGSGGTNALARQITGMIRRHAARPDQVDLGTILGDLSLRVDRFTIPFPVGTYYVDPRYTRQYLRDELILTTSTADVGDHGTHTHTVTIPPIPNLDYPLIAGDRVVVVWLNDGVDPFVASRLERTGT